MLTARRYSCAAARATPREPACGRTTRSRSRSPRRARRARPRQRSPAHSGRGRRQPSCGHGARIGTEGEPARAGREGADRALPEEHVYQTDDDGSFHEQRERSEDRRICTRRGDHRCQRPHGRRLRSHRPPARARSRAAVPAGTPRRSSGPRRPGRGGRSRGVRAASRRGRGWCRRRVPRRGRSRRSRVPGRAGSWAGRAVHELGVGSARWPSRRRPRWPPPARRAAARAPAGASAAAAGAAAAARESGRLTQASPAGALGEVRVDALEAVAERLDALRAGGPRTRASGSGGVRAHPCRPSRRRASSRRADAAREAFDRPLAGQCLRRAAPRRCGACAGGRA